MPYHPVSLRRLYCSLATRRGSPAQTVWTPILGYWLGHPVLAALGRASYSLYLVHWPVVSLMRYKVGVDLGRTHQLLAVGLTVILTLCLYFGVERRLSSRKGQGERAKTAPRLSPARFALATGATAFAASAVFAHAALTSGWLWRYDEIALTPARIQIGKSKRFSNFPRSCAVLDFPEAGACSGDKSRNILVFGNSHEPDGYTFFDTGFGENQSVQLIRFGQTNRCDYMYADGALNVRGQREDCQSRLDRILSAEFAGGIDAVVYASNRPFAAHQETSFEIMRRMKTQNPDLKIIALGGYLNTKIDCPRLINETGGTAACGLVENLSVTPQTDRRKALFDRTSDLVDAYIDLAALLCEDGRDPNCATETPTRVPFSYDRHHLSFEFAQYAGRKFADENPDFLADLLSTP